LLVQLEFSTSKPCNGFDKGFLPMIMIYP